MRHRGWLSRLLVPERRYVPRFSAGGESGGKTATFSLPANLLTVPLGMSIFNPADLAFFNTWGRTTDWVFTSSTSASQLVGAKATNKWIIAHNPNSNQMTTAINNVQAFSLTGILINDESSPFCATLDANLVARLAQANAAVPPVPCCYVPTGLSLENCIGSQPDWVTSVSGTVYQSQREMPAPNTANPVGTYIAAITPTLVAMRAAGTNTMIDQLSTSPPNNPNIAMTDVFGYVDAVMALPSSIRPDVIFCYNVSLNGSDPSQQNIFRRYRANG